VFGNSNSVSVFLVTLVHSNLIVVMMGDFRPMTAAFRLRLGHFLVFRQLPPACHAHNAIADSTNTHARDKRQQCGADQRLDRVDPMKDDELVDRIQYEGDDKTLAGNPPEVLEHDARLCRVACKGPEEDRPTFSGIRPSRSDRKKCRHDRLDDQPKTHRSSQPAEEFFPRLLECVFHGRTTLRYCTNAKIVAKHFLEGTRPRSVARADRTQGGPRTPLGTREMSNGETIPLSAAWQGPAPRPVFLDLSRSSALGCAR